MDFCFYRMVIASLLLAISAYQRFHGNTLFSYTRGRYSGDVRKQAQKRIKVNVPDGNHFMEDEVEGQRLKGRTSGSFPLSYSQEAHVLLLRSQTAPQKRPMNSEN